MAIIAFGADHAGYPLKQILIEHVTQAGHTVIDHGTSSTESVDYPAFCSAAARSVRDGDADLGIVLGGSGQGEQLAANKVRGVRAALCNCLYTARMAREHNDANVCAIGARQHSLEETFALIDVFISTPFSGDERHARRIGQIRHYEDTDEVPATGTDYRA